VKVLFDNLGNPHSKAYIEECLKKFGQSYSLTVRGIIGATEERIDKGIFLNNAARLMSNFKMTRRGPFKGVRVFNTKGVDNDRGILSESWKVIGESALHLKKFLISQPNATRQRVLVEISEDERKRVAEKLWHMFKQLLPLLMSETSLGLVGASKLLFSVFPEVALPVDNNQWRRLFQTVDYSDIICLMANEIIEWERLSGQNLDACDRSISTLPSIYNVMAMEAREVKTHKRSVKG
jgi:hypothetical protein